MPIEKFNSETPRWHRCMLTLHSSFFVIHCTYKKMERPGLTESDEYYKFNSRLQAQFWNDCGICCSLHSDMKT